MEKSRTTLVIEWSSLKETHHKAVFKKGVVGDCPCIKVLVETRQGQDQSPCRVEIGLLGDVLPMLYSERYRFMVGMRGTFEEALENLFDASAEEDLEDLGQDAFTTLNERPLGHALHPVFRSALAPFLGQGARS